MNMEKYVALFGIACLVILILIHIFSEDVWVLAPGVTFSDVVREGVKWTLKKFKIPSGWRPVRIVASWKKKNFTNTVGFFRHAGERTIHIYCHHPHHQKGDGIDVDNLSNTIIEETVHSIQIISQSDNQQYSKLLRQLGYEKNPYEIEAKKHAKTYTDELAAYLKEAGLLVKK